MNIEIKKVYSEVGGYFYLELDLDLEGEPDEVRSILGSYGDLVQVLRQEFREQRDLYKLLDEKYLDNKYSPGGRHFTRESSGWNIFVKDMTERDVRTLVNIYGDIITTKIREVRESRANQIAERLSISVGETTEEEVKLEEIDITRPSMIIANDKAYAIELKELKNIDTIDSIRDEVYETIKCDMESQYYTMRQNYEKKISKLEESHNKERDELFVDILRNSKAIFKNWEFIEENGALYLKYKDKIVTDKVVKNGLTFEYPGKVEGLNEMYVTGLKVRVTPIVTENDVKVTRGFNIHFSGTTGCIGDMNGRPLFEVLRDLPESLKIANMDSPLNDDASDYVRHKFLPYVSSEDEVAEWLI